jgi:tRNA pseudouridine38-40 synthase
VRVALGIEYDGSTFKGWQSQLGQKTVQSTIEKALGIVANQPIVTTCAGRTDAGVHALFQVIHFDTDICRAPRSWTYGCNANLPNSISVVWAKMVPSTFHARFSAIERTYNYLIYNRSIRSAIWDKKATWDYRPLNIALMNEACSYWLGTHDFSSFQAKGCQAKNAIRRVSCCEVKKQSEILLIKVTANAFLQHMVRNLAGVLMEIGSGRRNPSWAGEVLSYKDRSLGGVTALPDGLYLSDVCYPEEFNIPAPLDR